MKRFVLITVGFTQPTPEVMQPWMEWFKSIGDKIVEQVGLMDGREVTANGIKELQMDKDAMTGYLVIEAEDMEEALEITKRCPAVTSTLVYEVRSN
jgi:transcription antitermination factor NusG